MKKIILILLISCLFIAVNAKPLIVKTKYFKEIDVKTKVSSNKEKRNVFFEFDPEEKKTITINEEGTETILKVLKIDMNAGDKREDIVQIVFDCENSVSVIYQWQIKGDIHLIHIMIKDAPIVLAYSSVDLFN